MCLKFSFWYTDIAADGLLSPPKKKNTNTIKYILNVEFTTDQFRSVFSLFGVQLVKFVSEQCWLLIVHLIGCVLVCELDICMFAYFLFISARHRFSRCIGNFSWKSSQCFCCSTRKCLAICINREQNVCSYLKVVFTINKTGCEYLSSYFGIHYILHTNICECVSVFNRI